MKPIWKKLLLTASLLLVGSYLLPLLLMNTLDATSAMGGAMLIFFVFNPLLAITIGLIAGTEIKKAFWFVLLLPLLFPWLFSLAISELVLDLYAYSLFYLAFGASSMLLKHFFQTKGKQK